LFQPDDPLQPPKPAFDEPWQAQVLAMADTFVRAGRFSAGDWAEALGAHLRAAEAAGEPDSTETYFTAALDALEALTTVATDLTTKHLETRKKEWARAYRHTPHGQPVLLEAGLISADG
jgi:nitrile hydratase accessory protein